MRQRIQGRDGSRCGGNKGVEGCTCTVLRLVVLEGINDSRSGGSQRSQA